MAKGWISKVAQQAEAPKQSSGDMYFEPAPGLPAPVDPSVPKTFTDKSLPSPYQERFPGNTISPLPVPVPGTRIAPIPTTPRESAEPKEWERGKNFLFNT
jgi:hypothetical protein